MYLKCAEKKRAKGLKEFVRTHLKDTQEFVDSSPKFEMKSVLDEVKLCFVLNNTRPLNNPNAGAVVALSERPLSKLRKQQIIRKLLNAQADIKPASWLSLDTLKVFF